MISMELLNHYPFFHFLKPAQLKKIAKIATEERYTHGAILLREKEAAEALFILLQGSVELYFSVEVEYHPELYKEFKFRSIQPGETFGISALIEPYILTATARAAEPCRVIKIPADLLLALCQKDEEMNYSLMVQVAKTAIDRLCATRLQVAAAWSPEPAK